MTAKITLTWDNGSSEHVDQIVYRSAETFTVDSMPPVLARVGRNAREYIDTDIVTGNVYFYAVASENAVGDILLSSVISVTAVASTGDPHWDKVVALLHFDGDLTDESSGIWSVVSGDVAFHEGVFGTALLPIGSINLTCPSEPSRTDIRGADFTVEFFIKPEGTGNQTVLTNRPTDGGGSLGRGTLVRLTSERKILFAHLGQPVNLVSSTLTAGVFTHVAICWDSNSRRIYINGVLDVEDTNQSRWLTGATGALRIGRYQSPPIDSHFLQSPLDELRITKGVARYTENFTPSTEPFPNY